MSASKSQTGDYEAIRKDVVALLRQPDYDDGSIGPVLVRLAWYVLFSLLSSLSIVQSRLDSI